MSYNDKNALTRVRNFYPKVRSVVDATKSIQIKVSNQDVTGAMPKKPEDCAMARACRRVFKADGAIVRPSVAYIIHGTTATRYRVPSSVTREIVSFDRHKDFAPGEYQLSPIKGSARLGFRQGSDKPKRFKSTRAKPHVLRHQTIGIR
jgi:hypothetical protein